MSHGTGFQHPHGFDLARPPGIGEPGWHIHLTHKPRPEHPSRARVTTPGSTAAATFDDRDDAMRYLTHPGSIPLLAAYYLGWLDHDTTNQQERKTP